ncbi:MULTISPECIES: HPF/RaiA family ribosome-associated protein [unclassified Acidovorax]|uniref:HPF/RaiA family ribosome-associated protein n=1 Tax=unclassified Acidovorax TaxID=2684926 RepID=UPI0028834A28|nr:MULTISPECIES: HPF/RaiA family ribosome-associated protein [unclassified Acidovorax]
MQVFFTPRHPEAIALRELVDRRARFVLRRLSAQVPRADIQLDDVNGPRGGIDKRCQIELRTDGAGPVVVSSVAKDWRTALDGALARAARHVLRLWQRGSATRRPRRQLPAIES